MTSAVGTRREYDVTHLTHVLRRGLVLGLFTSVIVVLLSFITRYTAPPIETVLGGIVLLAGFVGVTALPGTWTGARTIEGIAGAAGIGLLATVVFMLVDVALLQPLGMWTNRWREIGGGSNWWYHPVWWMAGTLLPWLGALILANRAARGRAATVLGVMLPVLVIAVLCAVIGILLRFPGANWNLSTFGIAFLPGLIIAAVLSAVGRARP